MSDAWPSPQRTPLRIAAFRVGASLLGWGGMAAASLVWGILIVPPTLLLERFWPAAREHFAELTRGVLRLYVRSLAFARFEVEGAERRLRGARIVVANHQSLLDPIVLIALEPRLGGPVRRYIARLPVLGSIVRLAGFYPSDIGDLESLEALHRCAEDARRRGGGLLFFPEGTRTSTGEIGRFHRGAFRAAVDHDLPIQPVVIEGLDRVLPRGQVITRMEERCVVRIRYLDPIEPPFGPGLRREVVRSLCDRVRDVIVEELARLRAERDGSTAAAVLSAATASRDGGSVGRRAP